MSKSKKSSNNLLFNILACAGLVLLVLPMILAVYSISNQLGSASYGIFTDWSILEAISSLNTASIMVVDIMAVVLLCIAGAYLILFLLSQFTKADKNNLFGKINKLLAMVALLLTVVAIICVIVAFASVESFVPAIGFFMLVIGGVVFSVFGYLANKDA
ncbi:MAG: hypothetical protein IJZ26_01340 [Clostridia bacterium]|nr:hypothetical protein [Clostridia bacterium]